LLFRREFCFIFIFFDNSIFHGGFCDFIMNFTTSSHLNCKFHRSSLSGLRVMQHPSTSREFLK
jgi:hypothetical protein